MCERAYRFQNRGAAGDDVALESAEQSDESLSALLRTPHASPLGDLGGKGMARSWLLSGAMGAWEARARRRSSSDESDSEKSWMMAFANVSAVARRRPRAFSEWSLVAISLPLPPRLFAVVRQSHPGMSPYAPPRV